MIFTPHVPAGVSKSPCISSSCQQPQWKGFQSGPVVLTESKALNYANSPLQTRFIRSLQILVGRMLMFMWPFSGAEFRQGSKLDVASWWMLESTLLRHPKQSWSPTRGLKRVPCFKSKPQTSNPQTFKPLNPTPSNPKPSNPTPSNPKPLNL